MNSAHNFSQWKYTWPKLKNQDWRIMGQIGAPEPTIWLCCSLMTGTPCTDPKWGEQIFLSPSSRIILKFLLLCACFQSQARKSTLLLTLSHGFGFGIGVTLFQRMCPLALLQPAAPGDHLLVTQNSPSFTSFPNPCVLNRQRPSQSHRVLVYQSVNNMSPSFNTWTPFGKHHDVLFSKLLTSLSYLTNQPSHYRAAKKWNPSAVPTVQHFVLLWCSPGKKVASMGACQGFI